MDGWKKRLIQAGTEGRIPFVNQERAALTDEDRAYAGPGPFAGMPADERARAVLARMTLAEKIAFIGGDLSFAVRGIPRLGLPRVWTSDATGGIRGHGPSTSFPCMLALAATWNRDLVMRTAQAIAEEGRAKGISILLGPGLNIYRVPVCGRNFEYAGEDPILAGTLAASYIAGARAGGLLTTVKHFACNNSEYDRHKTDSVVDERTFREIYLRAFELAVRNGKSAGVMSSYNPVNGTYASANRRLLTEILRGSGGSRASSCPIGIPCTIPSAR
jgi:beta-glucosidase